MVNKSDVTANKLVNANKLLETVEQLCTEEYLPIQVIGNYEKFHNNAGHLDPVSKCKKCFDIYNNPNISCVPTS